jgi:outer membrane protein TolC
MKTRFQHGGESIQQAIRWIALCAVGVVAMSGCQTVDTGALANLRPAQPAGQSLNRFTSVQEARPSCTEVNRPAEIIKVVAYEPVRPDDKKSDAPVDKEKSDKEKIDQKPPSAAAPVPSSIPPSAPVRPIDLVTALAQAGVDNPTIELAQEQVREALGRQTAAQALLLPSLALGGNLRIHRGDLQTGTGTILDVNSQSLFLGNGALAVGAGTVAIPGVRLYAHLGDAILEPQAATQRLGARSADAEATRNSILLRVATAYLELVGAEAKVAALQAGVAELGEIVRLTQAYAKSGEGRQSDADRATTNAQFLIRQLQDAEGEAVAASARLTGLLSLDPTVRLTTPPGPLVPIRLIDENCDLALLVQYALEARPERAARAADLAEAHTRVQQEHLRPWLPTLSVGFSAGGFGGGSDLVDPRFGKFNGRTDFDAYAVWTIQNFGFGNAALTRTMRARTGQVLAVYQQTETDIREEVAEALASARTAGVQVELARQELARAREGVLEELKRTRSGIGRPLEALDSFRQWNDARLELVRTVTVYNIAQFRLWTAVGLPPTAAPALPCGK